MRPKRDPGGCGALVSIKAGIVDEEPRRRWRRSLLPFTLIGPNVLGHIYRRWLPPPGASEWISRVSSPATNRSSRTLKKGAGNLANSCAALQISLMIR
jgi:hypothetical protein